LAFYQTLLQSPAELAPELQQLLTSISPVALLEQLETTGLTTIDPCFPLDQLDAEGQPINLRSTNSWKLRLDNVDTVELMEDYCPPQILERFPLNNYRSRSVSSAESLQDDHENTDL
jgi:hypothetical protein